MAATLRTEARDRLHAAAGELTRDARAVLDATTSIELASTAEDPNEQAAAHAAYPDEHLADVGRAERLGYALVPFRFVLGRSDTSDFRTLTLSDDDGREDSSLRPADL